MNHKR